MFSIRFHQKNLHFFPSCLLKNFFQKFSSRFLFSKKMDDIIFFNLESSSRPIPDIFYILWEVFLIDFLSKMEPQKAWNSFGTILNWWNFGLHWIKFCILPCCELGPDELTILNRSHMIVGHTLKDSKIWTDRPISAESQSTAATFFEMLIVQLT